MGAEEGTVRHLIARWLAAFYCFLGYHDWRPDGEIGEGQYDRCRRCGDRSAYY